MTTVPTRKTTSQPGGACRTAVSFSKGAVRADGFLGQEPELPKTIDLAGALMLPPPPLHPTIQGPRGWRRFFAVAGIVGGFLFLFTIPGWAALGTYRRWKAGERGQPNLLIVWGVCFVLLCSAFVVVAVAARVAPAGTAKALSGIVPQPKASIPPGLPEFTSTPGEDGWTTYEVSAPGGFSIDLPEGWQPGTDGTVMPSETVFVASLFDANGGAMMAVARSSPRTQPRTHSRRPNVWPTVRRGRKRHARASGGVASQPAGRAKLSRGLGIESGRGTSTDTRMLIYGTTHEGYAYQFVFALPAVEGSYESDADYIARSFTWMD